MASQSTAPRVLILLLRRDLRLTDNPIFHAISQTGNSLRPTHLLPVFVFNATQVEVSGFVSGSGGTTSTASPFPEARSRVGGFWRCGPHRAKFLAESVWDMKERLRHHLGSDLVLRVGRPGDVLAALVAELQAAGAGADVAGLWMHCALDTEERGEERRVQQALRKLGVDVRLFEDGSYLFGRSELPMAPEDVPDVFTEFRKRLEPLRERIPPPLPAPTSLPPLPPSIPAQPAPFAIPTTLDGLKAALLAPLKDLGLPGPPLEMPPGAKSSHPYYGGETAAQQRVHHLLRSGAMTHYKETRNGLLGEDFSTKLAGWLAQGCLSARTVHAAMAHFEAGCTWTPALPFLPLSGSMEKSPPATAAATAVDGFGGGENAGTGWVRFELLWRDYFAQCTAKYGARLFAQSGYRDDTSYTWKPSSSAFSRWQRGSTGTGLVDASQRELYLTGWTSNRARQNVASFLAKRLGIDWRLGAEWYESLLVDYDVCSNWSNWQYQAGVGNDPHGENRVFNQIKQARDYDPKGEYVRCWVEELRGVEGLDSVFCCAGLEGAERGSVCAVNGDARVAVEEPLVRIEAGAGGKARGGRGGGRGSGRGRGRGGGGRGGSGGGGEKQRTAAFEYG